MSKIRVGKNFYFLEELIFNIPYRYEKKFLIDNDHLYENLTYVFTFQVISILERDSKVFMKGLLLGKSNIKISEHLFTVIHSAKMAKFFRSKKIWFFSGKFQDKTVFYPDILKTLEVNLDLLPLYSGITTSISFIIKKELETFKNQILKDIIYKIHFPKTMDEVNEALRQLLIYEVAVLFRNIQTLKKNQDPYSLYPIETPYVLSVEQEICWKEIQKDFLKPETFTRMIYGDVGTGKTLLAYMAANLVLKNGKKVGIMVPTSILANQIFEFFKNHNYGNYRIAKVAKDSLKVVKKNKHDYDIYIGTQALLYDNYIDDLGLLVIDEQHKFGVNQRNKLLENQCANVLMLTATPIPRTFQMILDGYISFSILKTGAKQGERQTIITSNLLKTLDKIVEISQNNKVVLVCKTIEVAEERLAFFNSKLCDVVLIHGKIKEKNDILLRFNGQSGGILISTTVIEVGIDIDLNYIFIENADMYGLAQIHQLRGRVGRRAENGVGYCILIGKNLKKLREIREASDGFAITEMDLEKRGAGMLHATSQSGSRFLFNRVCDGFDLKERVSIDADILVEARKLVSIPDLIPEEINRIKDINKDKENII